MTDTLKIDFVSDVACPWCAIGLAGLIVALDALRGEIDADLRFHPFELNPDMPAGGENGLAHVAAKYGIPTDQVRANRARIRERAAAVGFAMNVADESRVWNTFDAHRLIAWAGDRGRQLAMKQQLLRLYFTDGRNPGDPDTLATAAEAAGLDGDAARAVAGSNRHADQVRSEERLWRRRGIDGVPALVVADRFLISGGQPPDEYIRQLRAIAVQLNEEKAVHPAGT